jgi:biopolymer transport protein ExbD
MNGSVMRGKKCSKNFMPFCVTPSMKRNRTASQRRFQTDEPYLDVSSLIDVCFLLLIYFLVTTTIVKKEQDLDMLLPMACSPNSDFPPFVIVLAENGEVTVNPDIFPEIVAFAGGDRDLPELGERLDLIARSQGGDATVQLRIARGVEYQRFIDVMNCLAKEGISQTAIADL